MKRRIGTVAIGLAAVAALIAVPAAMAAYASPKLTITQTATGTVVKASLDPNDDPTAAVLIVAPNGTQLTTTQAPGTVLGPVKAIVKALDLAGADLPLEGQLIVAAPGQIPAATQAACIGPGVVPLATWVMVLTAAGQTLQVPTYLVKTGGALAQIGPAVIAICLPPPDVPVGTPGRATFGAKVYSAELAINGVFSPVTAGAWVSSWVPYTPGTGKRESRRTSHRSSDDRSWRCVHLGEGLRKGRSRYRVRHAGRAATRWRDRDGHRRLGEVEADDAQAREGIGEREVRGEVRGRDVLPRRRSRNGRVGTRGVRDAPAAPRRHPVREPDGERVRREEQGRQEEVATSQACTGAGP